MAPAVTLPDQAHLVTAAASIVDVLRANAEESEGNRQVATASVQAMTEAGL